jgi:hypothetical protein
MVLVHVVETGFPGRGWIRRATVGILPVRMEVKRRSHLVEEETLLLTAARDFRRRRQRPGADRASASTPTSSFVLPSASSSPTRSDGVHPRSCVDRAFVHDVC